MLVRRYQGRNEEEAIAKAKAELGGDAVILRIKRLPLKGLFDLKSAAKVEVIVACDRDFYEERKPSPSSVKSKVVEASLRASPELADLKSVEGKEPQNSPLTSAEGFRAYAVSAYSNVHRVEPFDKLRLAKKRCEGTTPVETTQPKSPDWDESLSHQLPKAAQKLYQHLLSHGVEEEVAQKLSFSCHQLISGESPLSLKEAMNICIEELIRTSGGLNIAKRPAVVAFVGPTGVGKTTTIAKLAAHYHLKENQKISLITVDTYRIAAIEQLKTYATYIGIPLEVALTSDEMHQLVRKYRNCDLILIDTPGRSQKDSLRIHQLAMILSAAKPTEVHLTLSVATEHRSLWDIVRGFKVLNPSRLLFTKLDESISFGHILNMSIALRKPISYLTTGQDVPDDIQLATIERITEYLLREEGVSLL